MSLPQPPVALKDHCSVIHNDTLYTYQADAFQSLPLKDGGTWSKIPIGVPTNGSTCVLGKTDGQDALFVLGGSTDPSRKDFSGMQRFSFNTKKWETCTPAVNVAKNRLRHGSAFLSQSASILIYGGSQDGNVDLPSSQTFLVSATPPYKVQAFSSDAPPVVSPLMMPWNTSHALMLGGSPKNTKLFTFGPLDGWQPLDIGLEQGLPDSNQVQATIIDGSDGSKILQLFNFNTTPNQISTRRLQQPTKKTGSSQSSSSPSAASPKVPTSASSSRKRKRATLADRPAYNSTLAPQTTRDGFALAADQQSGLVVASGGNSQDVLCIFNQTGNQWIDASQFFGSQRQDTSVASPTEIQSPAASLTGTPPPPSTSPASGTNTTHHSLTILGATLGSIFGVAALLLLLLLLLRCMRRRKEGRRNRRPGGFSVDDKHDMDFIDRGDHQMRGAGSPYGHKPTHSGHSTASANAQSRAASAQSKRGIAHKASGSNGSAKSFFSRAKSPTHPPPPVISEPIMHPPPGQRNFNSQPMASPEPQPEPRTDAGWSKYWAHNSNSNLGTNGINRHESAASRPTTYTSNSQSDYTTSPHPHESAEVEPLNIRTSQIPPNARVVSPTSGLPLPGLALSHSNHGPVGPEPISPSTMVSDMDEEDEYRLHVPSSNEGQDSWTPVQTSDRGSTWTDPRVSSVYADSMIYPHPGERVRIPNFPGVPASRRPSNNNNSIDPARGMRSTAARDFGRGNPDSLDEQRQLPEAGDWSERDQLERERMERLEPYRLQADTSTRNGQAETRTFPRRPEELGPRGRGGTETEDMSWLNLGR
ncbi:MAG: hypothetical protein L6R40_001188 [Gallowayella cf. fulva]|nr:MAG: hypothetical protein L6R40_001188 [Xanthomendoza cf. fulva]